jgi:hypothetical protein
VNGEALVSWTNLGFTFGGGVVVQRNTAAGWTPIGTGNGEVRQFTVGAVNDVGSSSSKLVPIGSELYLVLVSTQQVGGTYPNKVVLLRKVAN